MPGSPPDGPERGVQSRRQRRRGGARRGRRVFLGYWAIFYLVAAMAAASAAARCSSSARRRSTTTSPGAGRRSTRDERRGVEAIACVLKDRRLMIFIVSAVLFHFANAAMLPLVGQKVDARAEPRGARP